VASVFVLRRYYLGHISEIRGTEIGALKTDLKEAGEALDRHNSYDNHIVRVLDYFQRVLAKDINISVSRFIEAGVLQASREVMLANGHDQDLRLSVLVVEGEKVQGKNFRMSYAAGHDLESQQKYCVPVADTLSEVAMKQRVTQVWKDVKSDRHFEENPNATRPFRSMVSVPIMVGDEPVAIFNAITNRVDAFDATDVSCCTSLGSVITVALGIAVKERADAERRKMASQARARQLRQRRLPTGSPPRSVGSPIGPDQQEGAADGE
jgi:hypothetical protein